MNARRTILRVAGVLLGALLAGPSTAQDAGDGASGADAGWVVVVHPSNPARTLARSDLERIYRRRTTFWPDGTPVVPLNLPGSDPLRRTFTGEVLRSDEEELATWWNRAYFQGVSPPVVLQTGSSVKAYVAMTPGAIGYVPAADVDASVAAVKVIHER